MQAPETTWKDSFEANLRKAQEDIANVKKTMEAEHGARERFHGEIGRQVHGVGARFEEHVQKSQRGIDHMAASVGALRDEQTAIKLAVDECVRKAQEDSANLARIEKDRLRQVHEERVAREAQAARLDSIEQQLKIETDACKSEISRQVLDVGAVMAATVEALDDCVRKEQAQSIQRDVGGLAATVEALRDEQNLTKLALDEYMRKEVMAERHALVEEASVEHPNVIESTASLTAVQQDLAAAHEQIEAMAKRLASVEELVAAEQAQRPVVHLQRKGEGHAALVHIRIECPGARAEAFHLESMPNFVHVRLKQVDGSFHIGFERTFTFDHAQEGWFDLQPDETRYENGVLHIVLRRSKPRITSLGSVEGSRSVGPQQYLLSLSPPQTEADGSSDASWSFVARASPQTGSLPCGSSARGTSQSEAHSEVGPIKCYLPGTAFKNPKGDLVLVENLEVGQLVVLTDKTEAMVTSVTEHPWRKKTPYDIYELTTSQGSFRVSASHRVAIPGGEKRARNLKIGGRVFVGSKEQKLLNVCPGKVRTPLFEVSFSPDGIVEAFAVPAWGIHTLGEPPTQEHSSSSLEHTVPQSAAVLGQIGLQVLQLMGLANVTEEELQSAEPSHYED